ncbi:hypothetical protein ACFPU1_16090 [Thalassorhabdus alkalitolerans]|uniref:Uncharacterized protein n=1 Tax=Thalassorhabdus alkalitolerans TaxID=2282697 RepID=A0ABW0YS06_9BACI
MWTLSPQGIRVVLVFKFSNDYEQSSQGKLRSSDYSDRAKLTARLLSEDLRSSFTAKKHLPRVTVVSFLLQTHIGLFESDSLLAGWRGGSFFHFSTALVR